MRLMIAYDGSSYANAVIDDLPRAGLPTDSEVMVATVADFATESTGVSEFNLISAASRRFDLVLEQLRNQEERVLRKARRMINNVVRSLRNRFPQWRLQADLLTGRPAESLLRRAEEWNADLIAGGSRGRSAIGRFFLGSVSKSIAKSASASVRIVRRGFEKGSDEPIELILGIKDPAELEPIVEAVRRRVWPADTRIRIISTADQVSRVTPFRLDGSLYQRPIEVLESKGLDVSLEPGHGDPQTKFLRAVNRWRADAIFVAAGGGLDDTASALITDAECTVEIVR